MLRDGVRWRHDRAMRYPMCHATVASNDEISICTAHGDTIEDAVKLAHLIAALPELVEALRKIKNGDWDVDFGPHPSEIAADALGKAGCDGR